MLGIGVRKRPHPLLRTVLRQHAPGGGTGTQLQRSVKGLLRAQYLCCTCDCSSFVSSYIMYFLSTYYVPSTVTNPRNRQKGVKETHSLLSPCGRRQTLNKESHNQMHDYKSCQGLWRKEEHETWKRQVEFKQSIQGRLPLGRLVEI